ncbi:MAG: GAF domain-containing protein [Acidisphaera sp.]|nr:GAF domain-containing protein [Acidisphaera sp.]
MSAPRRLLARLRATMASAAPKLPQLVRLVSSELVAEVCSVYAMRPGDILELIATEGLNPEAVGHTRLRVGEGIVGIVAATGRMLNLPDAQNHPAFAYRPETGEAPFASLLAVPVRRAGHTLGVLAVQNRAPRAYTEDEVEVLETVAMVLAEALAAAGASDGAEEGLASTLQRRFPGTSLVPGLAIGRVVVHGRGQGPGRLLADDPAAELARLDAAVKAMQRGLDELIASSLPDTEAGRVSQAAIASREVLEAYRLVAAEGSWLRRVREVVRGGLTAEAAVDRVAGELRDRMRRIVDPYLRERVADIEDLAGRLVATLGGGGQPRVGVGAILVARRLGPAELLDWHAAGIVGVAVEEGSAAGHAAIIARALGLPALAGMRGVLEALEPEDDAVLDADEGQLILRPELEAKTAYSRALEARNLQRAGWAGLRDRPAATRDGTPVRLMLNVGLALELEQLDSTGAEGIGLFRTEIAMLARGTILDIAEQAAIYRRVLDAAGERPVLFRTLDLGGDKLLPDAPPPVEDNPAMGWRSLRIGLDRPVLLRRQLRALLQAAGGRRLHVMFPMVATVAEFRAARALLTAEAARADPVPAAISVGTMLEVPALLWQLEALLPEVDFVSVGSNDLMQFLFAADRGTPAIAGRYDMLSPPMLDILEALCRRAEAHGVALSVCGEVASRPLEALVLVSLGYATLSMPALGILPVKATLAAADLRTFRPVLEAIRHGADGAASLREPIAAWAREQGLPV